MSPTLPKTRAVAPDPNGLPLESLTVEEIGEASRSAQIDGLGIGALTGFLGGLVTLKVFRQTRNTAMLSGLMTGAIAGYIFTQTALEVHLAKASKTSTTLRDALEAKAKEDGQAAKDFWDNPKEGGAGGMEGLHDKYASTRGDH
ncbi:hypothetical protein RQP46_008867 [Phenoliferia psychrophenolica]